MASSTQSSSLDDHLNESSLTADLLEQNAFSMDKCINQSSSDLQANEQHQWDDELIHSTLPQFGSLDKQSKNNQQNYNYILDEEIQFIEKLTISKQKDETPTEELENQNQHKHRLLQEVRKTLPIYQFRTSLMQAIRDHQVLIIQGEAGSGKTSKYFSNLRFYIQIFFFSTSYSIFIRRRLL
jgi:HrpA-like RNA helicase